MTQIEFFNLFAGDINWKKNKKKTCDVYLFTITFRYVAVQCSRKRRKLNMLKMISMYQTADKNVLYNQNERCENPTFLVGSL